MQEAGSKTIVIYIFHNAKIFSADPDVVKVYVQSLWPKATMMSLLFQAVAMNVKNSKSKSFHKAFLSLYGERYARFTKEVVQVEALYSANSWGIHNEASPFFLHTYRAS